MKVLITGGSGFVGRNVIEYLRSKSPELDIFNLSNSPVEIEGVTNFECDAKSYDFKELNLDFDYIIHLLALSNEKYCTEFVFTEKINIGFTRKVLDYARTQKHLKKLIHMSSTIIYDNTCTSPVKEKSPLNLNYTTYSFTKGIAEYYVDFYREKYDLPAVIFRLSNIYGPYQPYQDSPFLVTSKIVEALTTGRISVFNLKPRRDWIFSQDAAEAVFMALDSKASGIYNLAGGVGVSVEEIVSLIADELSVTYTSIDKPVFGPENIYCDISRAKTDFNWQPHTSLREGIKLTIKNVKDRMNNEKKK